MLALAPIFDGRRAIPSPEVTRIILELLQLTSEDKLLEVGTGSGSQTQAFAKTGAIVHSVELEPWLMPCGPLGTALYLHQGDGKQGLPEEAPFTAIVATCGCEEIPHAWIEQLANDGRMVLPIGDSQSQRLTLLRKTGEQLIPGRIGAYVRFQMLREPPKPGKVKYASHQ